MEYISAREASAKRGLTSRMISYHCANGRIEEYAIIKPSRKSAALKNQRRGIHAQGEAI